MGFLEVIESLEIPDCGICCNFAAKITFQA